MVRTYLKLQSFTVGDFTKVSNRGSNESGSSTSDYDCEQHFKVLSGKKMVVYEWYVFIYLGSSIVFLIHFVLGVESCVRRRGDFTDGKLR